MPPQQQQQQQQLTANGEEAITCPQLWEQVKNHPQFDDIDIDQLCAEMRSKAKVCAFSKSANLSIPLAQMVESKADLESSSPQLSPTPKLKELKKANTYV